MATNTYAYHPVVIASGGTTSPSVSVGFETIIGFVFPASFEGATVTFTAATSAGGTYYTVKKPSDGTSVTVYAGASAFVPINPADLAGLQHFKIVSASSVAADRTIYVVTRRVS